MSDDRDIKPGKLLVMKPPAASSPKPNAEVIAELEKLLAAAERGEIRSIAFCCEIAGGELSTAFTAPEDTLIMAAGVGLLQHRYFSVHWGKLS